MGLLRFTVCLIAVAAAWLVVAFAAKDANGALVLAAEAKPRHTNWAQASQMPLPNVTVRLYLGHDPQSIRELRELYLPRGGHGGWTYWDERVLLYHELGHFYDSRHLNRRERNEFRAAVGSACGWWSTRCKVPSGEMFAEMYAACSFGMARLELDAVPAVSYGWAPPAGTDATLCDLIKGYR